MCQGLPIKQVVRSSRLRWRHRTTQKSDAFWRCVCVLTLLMVGPQTSGLLIADCECGTPGIPKLGFTGRVSICSGVGKHGVRTQYTHTRGCLGMCISCVYICLSWRNALLVLMMLMPGQYPCLRYIYTYCTRIWMDPYEMTLAGLGFVSRSRNAGFRAGSRLWHVLGKRVKECRFHRRSNGRFEVEMACFMPCARGSDFRDSGSVTAQAGNAGEQEVQACRGQDC